MLLKDKVAVVTGTATGIGEEIARLFAAEGAQVFLLDIDSARNQANAARIGAHALTVDVSQGDQVRVAFNQIHDTAGRVDILINNAGIYPRARFTGMSEAQWDRMFDVNLKSLYHTIQATAPQMLERGSGKIVNISSVTFHLGTAELSHYVATKGGVIGLTRSLAREFGPHNVHINCITPGGILTENEKLFVTDAQAQTFIDNQCLKRRILPSDIARTALFLSCELSDGLTGQTLNVDGGWAMH